MNQREKSHKRGDLKAKKRSLSGEDLEWNRDSEKARIGRVVGQQATRKRMRK